MLWNVPAGRLTTGRWHLTIAYGVNSHTVPYPYNPPDSVVP